MVSKNKKARCKFVKKKLSILLAMVMAVCCLTGLTACQKGGNGQAVPGVLTIRYYEGGYGSDWLKHALNDFAKENEGFKYSLVPDSTITNQVTVYLESGKNLSDIYMIQGGNWAEWVSYGYLANLSDVYETEVETSKGKRKIKDYMDEDLVSRYYMQKYAGQGDYLPWVLPEASIMTSFAYNEEYLLSTTHTTTRAGRYTSGDKWTAPPETVEELLDYCADLNARKDLGSNFAPFSWPGLESHWLKFLLYTWFAQYQGAHEVNALNAATIADEGSYYDFWNFASSEVWKMTGIQVAIDTLKSIFVGSGGSYKNSLAHVAEYSVQDAEKKFVAGESAMLVSGSFFYNEMKPYLDWKEDDGLPDYTFKMMYLPTIANAEKNEDGSTKKMVFYSTDEIILVPAKATNLDMAKKFLAYLFNEKNNLYFTQVSGTMRPFDYDPIALSGDSYEWDPFTASVLDMYNSADTRLYAYPAGRSVEDVSLIYRYKQPDIFGSQSWATYLNAIKKYTSEQIMITGYGSEYKSVFDATKKDFSDWYYRYYE